MKKKAKGEWGYINSQRKRVMLITLVLYVCAIGMYLLGYYTLKTNKSIWTILAVLAILPASKSMVNLIMFLRFKSLPEDLYIRYREANGNAPTLYEAPFTTYEKTYFAESLMCRNNTVILSVPKGAGGKGGNDNNKKLNEHLLNVLKNDGFTDVTVKVFDKADDYTERALALSGMEVKDEARDLAMARCLRSVVL
ncbi:MAG: hypothetical protein K5857_02240 [Lachnospiraceae bacterium]|nr:hypothetical protein [Lachnospiraceae bacterium]